MKERIYHEANINHSHNLVKSKVLVILRYKNTWHTTSELADLCKFKTNATMRSHCGVWSRKHVDKHGHLHDGILLRQARGLVGQHRPVWEYHISYRGIRWLKWNVDRTGLLNIIMNELGLEPKADSILPTTNGKSQTIEEQLIQKAIKEGIERALLNPVSTEPIGTPEAPDPELEHPDTILVKPNDNVSLPSGEVVNEVKAPDEVIPWYELPGVFPTRADLISDDDPPDVVVEKRVRAWQRAQDILKRELQDGNSKT